MTAERDLGRLDHVLHNHDTYSELAALGHEIPSRVSEQDKFDDLHAYMARGLWARGEKLLTEEQKATLLWVAQHCRAGAREWSILSGIRHSLAELIRAQERASCSRISIETDTYELIGQGYLLFIGDEDEDER